MNDKSLAMTRKNIQVQECIDLWDLTFQYILGLVFFWFPGWASFVGHTVFLKVKFFWSASMSGHIPKCIGTKCHNVRSYTQMHRREAPQCQVTYPNLYIAQWWSTRLSKLLTYRVWIFFYFGKKEKKKNARHASMMLLFDKKY